MPSTAATPKAPARCSRGRRRGHPATSADALARSVATVRQAAGGGTAPPARPAMRSASSSRSLAGHDDPEAHAACKPAIASRTTAAERSAVFGISTESEPCRTKLPPRSGSAISVPFAPLEPAECLSDRPTDDRYRSGAALAFTGLRCSRITALGVRPLRVLLAGKRGTGLLL